MAIVGVLLSGVISALAGALITQARRAERRAQRGQLMLAQELTDVSTAREQAEERVQLVAALADRTQQLLDAQIEQLIELERDAGGPAELDTLVALDHLAVQARRSAEAALTAAGRANPRRWSRPVALTDVTRAAVAEVDGYHRVQLQSSADHLQLDGDAVADVTHLVAEMIDAAFDRVRGEDVVNVRRERATITVRPAVPVGELVELLARRHGITVDAGPTATSLTLPEALLKDGDAPAASPTSTISTTDTMDATASTDTTDTTHTLDLADRPVADPVLPEPRVGAAMADAAWPLRAVPEHVIRSMSR